MPTPPSGATRVDLEFRQPGIGYLLSLYALIVAVWALRLLLPDPDRAGWERPVQLVFTIIVVIGAAMLARVRVWASPDALRARTQLGRRRCIEWSQILRVEARGSWQGLGVRTVDGRWIRLMQYGTSDRRAQEIAASLEDYRRNRQQDLGRV